MVPPEIKTQDKRRCASIKRTSCDLWTTIPITAFLLIGFTVLIILFVTDIIHVPERAPPKKPLSSTAVNWTEISSTATIAPKVSRVVSGLPIEDVESISNTQVGFVTHVRPTPTDKAASQH